MACSLPQGARDPRLAVNRFYAYALPFVWIMPIRLTPKVRMHRQD